MENYNRTEFFTNKKIVRMRSFQVHIGKSCIIHYTLDCDMKFFTDGKVYIFPSSGQPLPQWIHGSVS